MVEIGKSDRSVHLVHSFMCLALPHMLRRNWGRIINVASAHGLAASAGKSAYVAAKHGLIGLTKAVALENATTGVTCNAICPGWVLTPLVQKKINSLRGSTFFFSFDRDCYSVFIAPANKGYIVVFQSLIACKNIGWHIYSRQVTNMDRSIGIG